MKLRYIVVSLLWSCWLNIIPVQASSGTGCARFISHFLTNIEMDSELIAGIRQIRKKKIGLAARQLGDDIVRYDFAMLEQFRGLVKVSMAFAWHLHSNNIVKLSSEEFQMLYLAANIQSRGMLAIPQNLLSQGVTVARLSGFDSTIRREFNRAAHTASKSIPADDKKAWQQVRSIVNHHQELWNGDGPYGKKQEEIPLLSRMLALSDAWLLYRKQNGGRALLTKTQALQSIDARITAGHFDPKLGEHFLAFIEQQKMDVFVDSTDKYKLNRRLYNQISALQKDRQQGDGASVAELIELLSQYKKLEIVSAINSGHEVLEINGNKVELLSGTSPLVWGLHHSHIMQYRPKGSQIRILKLMNISAQDYLKEVNMANLGQVVDAPRLYGHGQITYKGDKYYYLDIAKQLPGRQTAHLKSAMMDSASKKRFVSFMNSNSEKVLDQIVRFYLRTIEERIMPVDPDLVLNEFGRIAWFDTGDWKEYALWDKDAVSQLYEIMQLTVAYLASMNKSVAEQIVANLKESIIYSEKLDKTEKKIIVENLIR
ncbi:MAG: hypothetical protein ISR65_11145 [Bacteriovoracaceae bacterium]|nr:hypothetical protein [Bacteriovoracaceae bacterium]